ncbi:MAG: flagellar basal body-associated FliL family protein [bacterium]
MTEEDLLLEEEEKKPTLLSNPVVQIAVIVISLAVAVSLSAIISFMVAKSYKPYILVISPEKEKKIIPPPEALNSSKMGDFLVRLTDPDMPRYLKVKDLCIAYDGRKYKYLAAEIGERKAQIKELINDILIKKSSDVATYDGKMALKKEFISEINKILNPKKGRIEDVYMEILIQ